MEEKKESFLEVETNDNRLVNQFENCRWFSNNFDIESEGKDLENSMSNLNINPKKRRLDFSPDKIKLKKIH